MSKTPAEMLISSHLQQLCDQHPLVAGIVEEVTELRAERDRLREIVDKLERTDDDTPMIPGNRYWGICRDRWAEVDDPFAVAEVIYWQGGGDECFNPKYTFANVEDETKYLWEFFEVSAVYATREAAEAARKDADNE